MNHLKSKGMLFILAVIAIYAVAHSSLMRSNGVDLKLSVFYVAGALSLICMSFAILISVRPKAVEGYLGGLDRMYQVHKWLGISAMIFFILHFGLSLGDGGGDDELLEAAAGVAVEEEEESLADALVGPLGMYSMIGFFVLIILTLYRKFAYHQWLKTHLLMGFCSLPLACMLS